MARQKSDKSDYVLVYDGQGGVRMAPAGTRIDLPPERHISWPSEPELHPTLETVTISRRPAYVLPVVGAACLCLAGLALGFFARPQLAAPGPPARVPIQGAPQQRDARMKVMVLAPTLAAPAGATPRAGRLDVLPADHRQGAAPATIAPAPRLASVKAAQPAPRAVDRAADCSGALGLAEAMVCGDPDLASADRRLGRAFRAAVRSGVPLGQLRAEQRDWLEVREDAAQHSPGAVAQAYDRRIEELEGMSAAAEPR